jgi:hypothetical protein
MTVAAAREMIEFIRVAAISIFTSAVAWIACVRAIRYTRAQTANPQVAARVSSSLFKRISVWMFLLSMLLLLISVNLPDSPLGRRDAALLALLAVNVLIAHAHMRAGE